MTTTLDRPTRPASRPDSGWSASRRTVLALIACCLGVVPLKALFTDFGWIIDVWLAMLVVTGPAILLRLRRPAGALDIWPGVMLLGLWLTLRFVPEHAWLHVIPIRATMHDLGTLMDSLHHTTRDEVAPVQSTPAVRLVLCALLGLLAALVDLVAVVGRRGALAGVPLLVVYTVSGAVPREPVSWLWFASAAAGFLILLSLDAGDELHRWGRRIPRRGGAATKLAVPVSAQRIGVVAIAAALLVPLVVPAQSRNLIADAFHTGYGTGGGGGSGTGGISPFANLKGELVRNEPINLMTVHVDNWHPGTRPPSYLRTGVLDKFTGAGWVAGGADDVGSVNSSIEHLLPPGAPTTVNYLARIDVTGYSGVPAVFPTAVRIDGLNDNYVLHEQFQVITGPRLANGDVYQESFADPAPTLAELRDADDHLADIDARPWLELPRVPSAVTDLVDRLTGGESSPYLRARAITDYFADPANGFQYSLKTKVGDSGSDLVDFLKNKLGFCQQYAAATAVMFRAANIPARVVLGYMHPLPDSSGNFIVSTLDAHAWVEAYFKGVGWVPFDPTPVDGLSGGSQSDFSYAPHVFPSGAGTSQGGLPSNKPLPGDSSSAASAGASNVATAPSTFSDAPGTSAWVGLGILGALLLALTPAAIRVTRRRQRLRAGRAGDPDPLWAELSDTAIDLGYVWSRARSPRQVASWLARDSEDPAALTTLAAAVEQHRYGPEATPQDTTELEQGLRSVLRRLRAQRSGRARLRATLWPASLRRPGNHRPDGSSPRRH